MRISLFKAATFALLGLGNVFPGVLGAPTSNAVEERSNNLVARTKAVPDITKQGYHVDEGTGFPRKKTYKVTTNHYSGALDLIRVEPSGKLVAILDANNDADETPNRAKLRDIVMYVYTVKGQQPASGIQRVRFEVVVEKTTNAAIKAAYHKLDKTTGDFTVKASDHGKEKEVFDSLSKTPFGKIASSYHTDYSAGQIKEIKIEDSPTRPTMEIHLG
ncbi:uncharacterized protein F4812DRAFT_460631 [Daldinia caldariorum]|uniref:uncharacterized protein n=1 Tax=Daldinia caldariorum TaxID=326644 RepID=UPI002008033C|nr:uncharacterized protein F4812DRAFT_460631 [Daldinia caldariorum]KAI1466358.1 hypothetical protein F4812DRAFT_460631 [Daldinia caldariorum]